MRHTEVVAHGGDGRDPSVMPKPCAVAVAQWILGQVRRSGEIKMTDAVGRVSTLFGGQFAMTCSDRTLGLRPSVLLEVRRCSGGTIDYDTRRRCFCPAASITASGVPLAGCELTDVYRSNEEGAQERLLSFYLNKIKLLKSKIELYRLEAENNGNSPQEKRSILGKLQARRQELTYLERKINVLRA